MQSNDEKNEKQLLAYIWQNQEILPLAMTELLPKYFVSKDTKDIFGRLQEAYTQIKSGYNEHVIDLPTTIVYKLTQYDFTKNITDKAAGYRYLTKKVLSNYKKRALIDMLRNTANNITTLPVAQVDDVLNDLNKNISQLEVIGQSNVKQGSADEDAEERKQEYIKIKEHPEELQLIKSGFKTIDETNGGFTYGELIYVIGRKADGKSVLLLNFAYHMWRQNKNVILFSLEISRKDYLRRFDSRAAGVPSKGIKLGTLSPEDEEKYFHYLENINKGLSPNGKPVGTFYVVDIPGRCTPAYIETKTEEVEQKLGISFDCIISDYSQIMEPDIKTDIKRDNLGAIAMSLKQLARKKNKIVMSAAQMTRAGKTETSAKNGHAGTEHVAESDQISDHLDWGIAIRSVTDKTGVIESFKTRDGAAFEFPFEKQFDKMNIIEQQQNDWEAALKEND